MKHAARLALGYAYVFACPFILGGFVSLVLGGPWAMAGEALVWLILWGWFDNSQLQHDL